MTKRKKDYQYSRPANKRAPAPGGETTMERPNLATINLEAATGRAGFSVGDTVVVSAAGLYSGEIAVIERLSSGVIPSAQVRTRSGGTRQVRTIDLRRADTEKSAES